METGLGVGGVLGFLDAVVEVGVDEFLGKGFKAFASGDDLHEDFGAIAVGVEHSLNGGELSADFAGAEDECLTFDGWVGVFAHGGV